MDQYNIAFLNKKHHVLSKAINYINPDSEYFQMACSQLREGVMLMILDELKNFYSDVKVNLINELNLVSVIVRLLSSCCENQQLLTTKGTMWMIEMIEPMFVNDYEKYLEDKEKETFIESYNFNISSPEVLRSFFIQDGFSLLNQFYDDNPRKFDETYLYDVKEIIDTFGEMVRN